MVEGRYYRSIASDHKVIPSTESNNNMPYSPKNVQEEKVSQTWKELKMPVPPKQK